MTLFTVEMVMTESLEEQVSILFTVGQGMTISQSELGLIHIMMMMNLDSNLLMLEMAMTI